MCYILRIRCCNTLLRYVIVDVNVVLAVLADVLAADVSVSILVLAMPDKLVMMAAISTLVVAVQAVQMKAVGTSADWFGQRCTGSRGDQQDR